MSLPQQNNVFIDPETCGSSVGYYMYIEEYTPKEGPTEHTLHANVVITDCNRKVDWCFGGDNDVDKINAAISLLQEFRKKYIETQKLVTKLNK